jgi:hypothetical protein
MDERLAVSRRALLAAGITATASLAGCSGNDSDPTATTTEKSGDSTDTPQDTPSPTDTPAPTTEPPTTTERTPTPSGPSLSEFDYPDGASQSGIDAQALYGAHESTLTGAGSLTVESTRTTSFDDFQETLVATNEVSADGVRREVTDEEDNLTETLWSPASEQVAYVQMAAGFEKRYRIDNQAPNPGALAELRRFQVLLAGAEWSEATDVVETADGDYEAVYEATGVADEESLLRIFFGDTLTEFEATVSVTQSGYVGAITYDVTVQTSDRSRREDAAMTVGVVGDTTVDEPEWAETARENGARFDAAPTDDRTAIELEMVNGTDLPGDTRLSLSDGRQRGETTLSDTLSEGGRLYLSLSEDGSLLVGTDGVPEGARPLERRARVALRYRSMTFLEQSMRF